MIYAFFRVPPQRSVADEATEMDMPLDVDSCADTHGGVLSLGTPTPVGAAEPPGRDDPHHRPVIHGRVDARGASDRMSSGSPRERKEPAEGRGGGPIPAPSRL